MKKIFTLILFCAISFTSIAQSVSFSVMIPPCNNDGTIRANISGMVPPFTVKWTTFGTNGTTITHTGVTGMTDLLTSYSGGPVTVSVTNATTAAINTYSGAPPLTYSVGTTAAICPALGSATVTVTGGTAPYAYQWYDVESNVTVGASAIISKPGGKYGITITDNAGCKYGSKVDPTLATIAHVAPFTVSLTATPANCTNGSATATPSAGVAMPVTYAWSNGATTPTISGLISGNYGVTVTDATGCVSGLDTGGFADFIFVPQAISISAGMVSGAPTCTNADGTASVFASGGTAPYTYLWSNGATSPSQTGLAAGNYAVTVTDANGCSGTGNASLVAFTPIAVTYSSTPTLCTSPTGNASLSLSGGTPPYSIMWYTTPAQTAVTATNLAAGNYDFKVTDAAGCERTGTVQVFPISNILPNFSVTGAICTLATGGASVAPTGGSAPYSYLWSTGASTSFISGVATGTYNVTITDNVGCSVVRPVYVPSSSTVSASVVSTPASCIYANDGTLTAVGSGGTPPYTFGWSSGGTSSIITGLASSGYWVDVTDAAGCTASKYSYVGYDASNTSCYCTIAGTVFNDLNHNCTKDAGEPGIPNIQLFCTGRGYTYTDASGNYSFIVPSGSYNIFQTVKTAYPLATCQVNGIPVTAVAASGCVQTVNFADTANPIHDIHVSNWNYFSPPVPGNSYTHSILVTNEGSVVEDSILATYKPDGQLFAPTFVPTGTFTGTPYSYSSLTALNPGVTKAFYATYNVPANIPINTSVVFIDTAAYKAPLTNWLADYTPWNNVVRNTQTVVASYDPNFKQVSPKGTGPTGIITANDTVLEYMVHFQNTGSWYAQNVVVIDTLDNNLNWATLQTVYMSSACNVTLKEVGLKRVATFTFSNVNLPPQMFDDVRSNGMFTYTIKTNSGLPAGTQIRNRASIYFDYNAPVATNITLNTIGTAPVNTVETVAGNTNNTFSVYPNPASKAFSAVINSEAANTATMSVCDLSGKTLVNQTIEVQKGTQVVTTDISQLTPGIYFVTLNENGKVSTQKLVVIK
jgi:uncharacterized repeat protein (TIGR01451 family)